MTDVCGEPGRRQTAGGKWYAPRMAPGAKSRTVETRCSCDTVPLANRHWLHTFHLSWVESAR